MPYASPPSRRRSRRRPPAPAVRPPGRGDPARAAELSGGVLAGRLVPRLPHAPARGAQQHLEPHRPLARVAAPDLGDRACCATRATSTPPTTRSGPGARSARSSSARSPSAQFDVVLNADQYRTPAAVTRTMRRLSAKLGNEGWFFDFFSSAARRHPKMVKAAIAWAHTPRTVDRRQRLRPRARAGVPGERRLPQRPGRRLSPQPARRAADLEAGARPLPPQQRPRRQGERRLPVHQGATTPPAGGS